MFSPTPRTSICTSAFAGAASCDRTSASSVMTARRGKRLICKVGMTPLWGGKAEDSNESPVPARGFRAHSRRCQQSPDTLLTSAVQPLFRLSRLRALGVEASLDDPQRFRVRYREYRRATRAIPGIQHEWRGQL